MHKILGGCSLGTGAAGAVLALSTRIEAMYVFWMFVSLFGGALDLGGNVLIVEIWEGDRRAAPAMNLLHFCWGAGSLLCRCLLNCSG